MNSPDLKQAFARFDLRALAAGLPETADTLLVDRYLTDREAASARIFRVYRGTPAHYHAHSDEYLYVLSGRGTFWMGDVSDQSEFGPGDMLFFERGTVHALPDILEEPLVFLAVDAPRRAPADVIFVEASAVTVDRFVAAQTGPLTDPSKD